MDRNKERICVNCRFFRPSKVENGYCGLRPLAVSCGFSLPNTKNDNDTCEDFAVWSFTGKFLKASIQKGERANEN